MEMPNAEALMGSLHGAVYCATIDAAVEDRHVIGWGGGGNDHASAITISAVGVEIETSARPVMPPEVLARQLLTLAVARVEVTFPLTLTVERSTHVISIDGRDNPFTGYTCAGTLAAEVPLEHVAVRMTCPVTVFQRGFRIISLPDRDVRRLVHRAP